MTVHPEEKAWRIGLIGRQLEHSASPALFADLFASSGVPGSYELLSFPDDAAVRSFLASEEAREFDGFNVTVPYKRLAADCCEQLTPRAAAIGAVNVLLPQADGQFRGDNTDSAGFMESIRPFLASAHERALIIGRGGAAMAAAYGLQAIGVEVVHLVRSLTSDEAPPAKRRELLIHELRPEVVRAFLLIVQASPVGMWPNTDEAPTFLYGSLGPDHLCVDLVYNPAETQFLAQARQQGATTLNGLGMLSAQAAAGWRAFQLNRQQGGTSASPHR